MNLNKILTQLNHAEERRLVEHWNYSFDYNRRTAKIDVVLLPTTSDDQIQKLKDILIHKYGAQIRDDNYFSALKYFGDSQTCDNNSRRFITFTICD
jgi:hypothetical protein